MTRDEILALCERRQEAFDRADLEALAPLYADTAVLNSPMTGIAMGRDAVVKATGAFFAAFPDAKVVAEPPLIDGGRVAILAEVSGTHNGALMALPPSGKPFRFKVVFALEVADHHIVNERRIYDFTGLLVQIGVLKAKPA